MATAALALVLGRIAAAADTSTGNTVLAVERSTFTINGRTAFLLGASYYGGLGTDESRRNADFDRLQKCGVNWVRVWATWAAFGGDLAAVDATTGEAKQPYLSRLKDLVADCDRRALPREHRVENGRLIVLGVSPQCPMIYDNDRRLDPLYL